MESPPSQNPSLTKPLIYQGGFCVPPAMAPSATLLLSTHYLPQLQLSPPASQSISGLSHPLGDIHVETDSHCYKCFRLRSRISFITFKPLLPESIKRQQKRTTTVTIMVLFGLLLFPTPPACTEMCLLLPQSSAPASPAWQTLTLSSTSSMEKSFPSPRELLQVRI